MTWPARGVEQHELRAPADALLVASQRGPRALAVDAHRSRVEEKSRLLRVAGTTYSSVALSDFMANLRASGKFKEVDLVESRQDLSKSPRTITFEVTCHFEI